MASELQVIAVDPPERAIEDAFAYLARLEQRWSRFLPHSDITRLNQAGGRPVVVEHETVVLIFTMVEAWRITAGGYDPTLLHALEASGYLDHNVRGGRRAGSNVIDAMAARSAEILPDRAVRTLPYGSPQDIEVDAQRRTVRLPAGMALDPGGIGKGLAADLAFARLVAGGCAGALVSVGGDMAMGGVTPTEPGWLVEVEHAEQADGVLTTLAVSGGGVATSSTRSRRWHHQGVERHHHLDPRSGEPSCTDLAAVTVVARSGWLAEAHATAALGRDSHDVLAYLDGHGLDGLAITSTGAVLRTEHLR